MLVSEANVPNYKCSDEVYNNYRKTALLAALPVTQKRKLYVAGPWFDDRAKNFMEDVKKVFEAYEPVSAWEPYFPMDHTKDTPYDTFLDNVNQIRDCDAVLAIISSKDVGTSFEIGFARGLGRRIFILTFDETCYLSKTNIMLAYSTDNRIALKNLGKFVTDQLSYSDYIKIDNNWENKE